MVIKHWLHSAVICLFFPSFPPLSLPLSKPALRFQLFMDWERHITGRGSKSDCRNPDSLEFIGSISSWTRARQLGCMAPEVWMCRSPSRTKWLRSSHRNTSTCRHRALLSAMALGVGKRKRKAAAQCCFKSVTSNGEKKFIGWFRFHEALIGLC